MGRKTEPPPPGSPEWIAKHLQMIGTLHGLDATKLVTGKAGKSRGKKRFEELLRYPPIRDLAGPNPTPAEVAVALVERLKLLVQTFRDPDEGLVAKVSLATEPSHWGKTISQRWQEFIGWDRMSEEVFQKEKRPRALLKLALALRKGRARVDEDEEAEATSAIDLSASSTVGQPVDAQREVRRSRATPSDATTYLKREAEWLSRAKAVGRQLDAMLQLSPGSDEQSYVLPDAYTEENKRLVREMAMDALRAYRALRPLETSPGLAETLDGSALFISFLARDHESQLEVLRQRYPKPHSLGLRVYLLIGAAQAMCDLSTDAVWTFRQAIRLARAMIRPNDENLFVLTYNVSRVISILDVAPEHDLALGLVVFDDHSYGLQRYRSILASYRAALEGELLWQMDYDPYARSNYGLLMEAVGFWHEALPYLEQAATEFPGENEFEQKASTVRDTLDLLKSAGTYSLPMRGIHRLPPLLSELGQRFRCDELIQLREPEFWKTVIGGVDRPVKESLVRRLFLPDRAGW